MLNSARMGGVAEWSNADDLKSSVPQGTVGSNPTASAKMSLQLVSHSSFPTVSRSRLSHHYNILKRVIDSAAERRKLKLSRRAAASATFSIVAEEWFAVKAAKASANYKRDIRAVLNVHLLPKLGPLPISEIDASVLLGALRAVEARGKLELAALPDVVAASSRLCDRNRAKGRGEPGPCDNCGCAALTGAPQQTRACSRRCRQVLAAPRRLPRKAGDSHRCHTAAAYSRAAG